MIFQRMQIEFLSYQRNVRIVLAFILLFSGFFSAKTFAELNQRSIVIFGDSLSSGYGLGQSSSWVDLLEARLNAESTNQNESSWRIVNASIAGETTTQGVKKLSRVLEREKPSWVILELGGNDGLRGTPLTLTQENLSRMVDMVESVGAKTLLVGMQIPPNYGPVYSQQFESLFYEVAKEKEIDFLPFLLEGIANDRSYFQKDQIHPNASAQPIIMETVWRTLRPLLMKE